MEGLFFANSNVKDDKSEVPVPVPVPVEKDKKPEENEAPASPRHFIAFLSSKVSPTAVPRVDGEPIPTHSIHERLNGIATKLFSNAKSNAAADAAESIPSHSMHERFNGLATKLFSGNNTEAEENENNRFDIRVFLTRLQKVAPAAVAAVVAASVALDAATNKISIPTIDLGRNKQEIQRLNEELLVMQQTHHEKLNDSEMALLLRLEKSLEMQIRLRQDLVSKSNECTKLQTTINDTENALAAEKANVARALTANEQTIQQARASDLQASQNINQLQSQMQRQTQESAQQVQQQTQRAQQLESEVQTLKQTVMQLTNSLGQAQAESMRSSQLAQEQQQQHQHLSKLLDEEKTARANEGVLARGKISVTGAQVVELERQVETLTSEKQSLTAILMSVEEMLEETEKKLSKESKEKKKVAEERDDFSVQVTHHLRSLTYPLAPILSHTTLHTLLPTLLTYSSSYAVAVGSCWI